MTSTLSDCCPIIFIAYFILFFFQMNFWLKELILKRYSQNACDAHAHLHLSHSQFIFLFFFFILKPQNSNRILCALRESRFLQ